MELGEDGLKTLECLRGRLLAERNASKVANEKAEFMIKKLIELEKKLKEETKLRRNAEKKLEKLMKKLESLKVSPTLEDSQLSSSSENSVFSCKFSLTNISCPKDPEESESNHINLSLPVEESSSTQNTCNSNSLRNSKDAQVGKSQYSSTYHLSSEVKMEKRKAIDESENEDSSGYKSMALAPVNSLRATIFSSNTKASELDSVDKSVSEVLDAFRLVRERMQSSIGRRHMIRVPPP